MNETSSHHNPILITLESPIKKSNNKLIYDYDSTDWGKFKQTLQEKIAITTNIKTPIELEHEVHKLTITIQNCIKQNIPVKTAQQLQDKLSPDILQLITYKNKIRKKWQITKNFKYKDLVKIETKVIRIAIAKHRNDIWTKKLKKINSRDNTLWRMTKIFKNDYNAI